MQFLPVFYRKSLWRLGINQGTYKGIKLQSLILYCSCDNWILSLCWFSLLFSLFFFVCFLCLFYLFLFFVCFLCLFYLFVYFVCFLRSCLICACLLSLFSVCLFSLFPLLGNGTFACECSTSISSIFFVRMRRFFLT